MKYTNINIICIDSNYLEVLNLHALLAQKRVNQIFNDGIFIDEGRKVTGKTSTLVLSYEKKLAVEFVREADVTSGMTMRFRKMDDDEICKNHLGQNNHYQGQRI